MEKKERKKGVWGVETAVLGGRMGGVRRKNRKG